MNQKFTAKADAGGAATVYIRSNGYKTWVVQQISTIVDPLSGAPAGSVAIIRKNGVFVTRTIPTGGVASGLPYVDLDPKIADEMTVEFTGLTPGTIATENVFYELKEGE